MTNNEQFNKNVEVDYHIHVEEDDKASDVDDYFSDEDIPVDETDEVTDDYFFAHLHDDTIDRKTNDNDAEIDDRKPAAKVMSQSDTKRNEEFDDRKPAAKSSVSSQCN